jgi:glucokinase
VTFPVSNLSRVSVGVDIGGTSTKAAVIDDDGAVLLSTSLPTQHGSRGVTETAFRAIDTVLRIAELAADSIHLIGVGIPGAVDPSAGTVRHAVNVGIGSEAVAIASALSDRFGRPVHLENDVKAAALGAELVLGSVRGAPADLAYLSIGTGIAAGFVENGRLRRGYTLVAGEIGHIPIDPAGPICACGQTGCIEAIASGSAIERAWPSSGISPSRALAEAAAAGDPQALVVWSAVVGGLSRAVLLLALTMDPELIVLSGGVAELGDVLRDAIVHRLLDDQRHSDFLSSLAIGDRMHVIDPSILLGPIGAVRAAQAATTLA